MTADSTRPDQALRATPTPRDRLSLIGLLSLTAGGFTINGNEQLLYATQCSLHFAYTYNRAASA